MRTKTTLLCAAALAAGVASSWAQSNVYSLNIVGYANVPLGPNLNLLSSPFAGSPNDYATNIFPNVGSGGGTYSGQWDNSQLQIWTGVGFSSAYFDSETTDTTTGFENAAGNAPVPCPLLASGLGFYLYNQANNLGGAGATNVTFVGTVRTGTNSINYPTSPRAYFVGSPLPIAGGVMTTLGFSNPGSGGGTYSGVLDNSYVETATISSAGAVLSYNSAYFDSETTDTTTGFENAAGNAPVPEPQIAIGGGFLFVSQANNEGSTSYTWTQILNP